LHWTDPLSVGFAFIFEENRPFAAKRAEQHAEAADVVERQGQEPAILRLC